MKESDRARLCPRGGRGRWREEGGRGVTPTQGMTYAGGLSAMQRKGGGRIGVVCHPIGRGAFGRPPPGRERLKRAQSERELDTRLALLAGLECRVRLDGKLALAGTGRGEGRGWRG